MPKTCGPCKAIPIRAWVAILIFFGSLNSYMLRVNMSIAVLGITDGRNFSIGLEKTCNVTNVTKDLFYDLRFHFPSFNHKPLGPLMVAILFAMYDSGFLFSILISKMFAAKWGPTRVIGYSTLLASILTLATPKAYYFGVNILLATRFLIGFLLGFLFPLLHILIMEWSAERERSCFVFTLYGASIGMGVTFPLCAYILKKLFWNWIMYITGLITLIWSCIWLGFVTDSIDEHPYITEEEIFKIQYRRAASSISMSAWQKIPWRRMAKSIPLQALIILLWGNTWNLSFYMDYMPMLFYYVFGYDLITASLLSAAPILGRMFISWMCMPLVHCLILRYKPHIGVIRKIFTVFSHILPGTIQLIMVSRFCDRQLTTIEVVMFLILNGAVVSGGLANTVDLTPRYAGNLYTVMQGFLWSASIIMPFAVAILLIYYNRAKGWEIILIVNAAMYLVGGILFLVFGSGSVQPFDSAAERRSFINYSLENLDDRIQSYRSRNQT